VLLIAGGSFSYEWGDETRQFKFTIEDYHFINSNMQLCMSWLHTGVATGLGLVREYKDSTQEFLDACNDGYDILKPLSVRATCVPDDHNDTFKKAQDWWQSNYVTTCGDASRPIEESPCTKEDDGKFR
jgi:hypothetical protein